MKLGERVDISFVAKLAGYSRHHIARLCNSGKIPGAYRSAGGHWRCRWSKALAQWIAQNQRFTMLPRRRRGDIHTLLWDELQATNEALQLLKARGARIAKMLHRVEKTQLPVSAYLHVLGDPRRGMEGGLPIKPL